MKVHIKTKFERHECGMCGPSARRVSTITIDEPAYTETWTQSLCDNGDQMDDEGLLRLALEAIGYEVVVESRDDW